MPTDSGPGTAGGSSRRRAQPLQPSQHRGRGERALDSVAGAGPGSQRAKLSLDDLIAAADNEHGLGDSEPAEGTHGSSSDAGGRGEDDPARRAYRGVKQIGEGRWRAQYCNNGMVHQLGVYATAPQAAQAWDCVCWTYRRSPNLLNFPQLRPDYDSVKALVKDKMDDRMALRKARHKRATGRVEGGPEGEGEEGGDDAAGGEGGSGKRKRDRRKVVKDIISLELLKEELQEDHKWREGSGRAVFR